ncbi:MAG: DUF3800 domain-containing protein, partial [Candidatus Binatia bacterium]
NRTREEFSAIFDRIKRLFPEALKELKSTKIFYGRDRWRDVHPNVRKAIFQFFSRWICDRKHRLALAAIDKATHREAIADGVPGAPGDIWLAGALHIALQVQRAHKSLAGNKGHTFLIFDENKAKGDRLPELLYDPPEWTDTYYDRRKKQPRLDQVIDSAFFVKSHHAGLVQVADLFSFVFRRYAELSDYAVPEVFDGERRLVEYYVRMLARRLLPRSHRWPQKSTSACARWFKDLAPESLKDLD